MKPDVKLFWRLASAIRALSVTFESGTGEILPDPSARAKRDELRRLLRRAIRSARYAARAEREIVVGVPWESRRYKTGSGGAGAYWRTAYEAARSVSLATGMGEIA